LSSVPLDIFDVEDPFAGIPDETIGETARSSAPNWKDRKTSGRHSDKREHYPRVIKALRDGSVPSEIAFCAGGFFWKCDYKEIIYTGQPVSKDILGFMDIQGLKAGRFIGLNITSKASMGTHISDYVGKKTHGQAKVRVEVLLREFLANGGVFLIAGYHRPGTSGKWLYEWLRVTPELLDKYKARKRS
jgi:hypothetical protein